MAVDGKLIGKYLLFGQHMIKPIATTRLEFTKNDAPSSANFNDIYYNPDDGIGETEHVFLHGCQVDDQLRNCNRTEWVVAETGFGTGLNFFCLLNYIENQTQIHPRLNTIRFISCEAFPIEKDSLTKLYQKHFASCKQRHRLLNQYPAAIGMQHDLRFSVTPKENRSASPLDDQRNLSVILELHYQPLTSFIELNQDRLLNTIDCWFLDGFAPAKNPDMWTEDLFRFMQRSSKTGAKVSTFTAAGIVKRGLEQHGFKVTKIAGFGRKREMITAEKRVAGSTERKHPYFQQPAIINNKLPKPSRIAVVGAGIAAATLCYKLRESGLDIDCFFNEAHVAGAASGNHSAGVYPPLSADVNWSTQFHLRAFSFAQRWYQALALKHEVGMSFNGCALLAHNQQTQQRYQKLCESGVLPNAFLHWESAEQLSERLQQPIEHPGIWLAEGGWVCPYEIVSALFERSQQYNTKLYPLTTVQPIDTDSTDRTTAWLVITDQHGKHTEAQYDAVIWCGGGSLEHPSFDGITMGRTRGQVETVSLATEQAADALVCHDGYLTPVYRGALCLGSTYVKTRTDTVPCLTERAANFAMHHNHLKRWDWLSSADNSIIESRVGLRAAVPDHLPVVGALPNVEQQRQQYQTHHGFKPSQEPPESHNGQYCFTALGSRGFTTAPILANHLASQLLPEQYGCSPLNDRYQAMVAANRFVIKELKRMR